MSARMTGSAGQSGFKPVLWTPGDWNAFFGFGTNILVNMLVLTGLLRFVLKMPDTLVFGRILPALGLMMCLSTFYYAFLAYRLAHGAPADEPTLERWEKVVSHITHWAIYALLIIVPLLGWLAISYYGPFEPFGIKLPSLAAQDDAKATKVFFLHMLGAYTLIVLLGMHVGAALMHYVIKQDGVLRRMWVRAGRLS